MEARSENAVTAIRILHSISTLAPTSGGPTSVLRNLAIAQAEAGHVVTVCTTDRGNPVQEKLASGYFKELYPEKVAVEVFPVSYTPLLFSPRLARWLRESVQLFDVIHVHGLYRFPPTYTAYQARAQGVPYIVRPHGALDPYLYGKSTHSLWLKRLYEHCFDLPNLRRAGAIHYTAEEERERAVFMNLRVPSFVVPNGVDWQRFECLPERGALRNRWGLGEAPIVLFLGRLHFKKGLDLLIPAFDALRQHIPEAHLVIAGPENDDYGKKVRGWVAGRGLAEGVHFVGPLHGVEVLQAYVDADIFVLPSYTENFGITVAEAMGCAIPVVISDQVNIHDEVTGSGAGLVTSCDSVEITAALESLLRQPEQRKAMGMAGRQLVSRRYTWPSIVTSLTHEYESVIESHLANRQIVQRHSQV